MSEELTNNESQMEATESSLEMSELDDATFEPRTVVEQSGDFQQSEEIQDNLVSITQNVVEATPINTPGEGDEPEVRGDLDQAVVTSDVDPGDEATPINLPDVQRPNPAGDGTQYEAGLPDTSMVEATPITLPDASSEVEATPITLPDASSEVEATPITLPDASSEVEATPITLPDASSEVEATPIPLPDELPEPGSDVEVLPVPIPGPGVVDGQAEIRGDIDQAIIDGSDDNKDQATPINTPGPVSVADKDAATPINTPGPVSDQEISKAITDETAVSEDQGLAEEQSDIRTDLDQVESNQEKETGDEATPINLPDVQKIEVTPQLDAEQVGGIENTPESASQDLSEPDKLANFKEPILMEDQHDLGPDVGTMEDLDGFFKDGSDIGGQPEDDFWGRKSGGGLDDMPGYGSPGGIDNDPGGPEMPAGGIPGQSELMGGSDAQYQRARELADMEGHGGLKYNPSEQGVPKDAQMNPFNDTSPATRSDYDEFEKDKAAHSKAQVDFLNESQKQLEAKKKQEAKPKPKQQNQQKPKEQKKDPPKPKPKKKEPPKTTPVGDGGGGGGSETPNIKYNPDLISLSTADDQGEAQPDGILPKYQERVKDALKESKHSGTKRAGAELVTDPLEDAPKRNPEKTGKEG